MSAPLHTYLPVCFEGQWETWALMRYRPGPSCYCWAATSVKNMLQGMECACTFKQVAAFRAEAAKRHATSSLRVTQRRQETFVAARYPS